MSFYTTQNDSYYLAEKRQGWTYVDYLKQVGNVLVLNVSDRVTTIDRFKGTEKVVNPHPVAGKLIQVELIEDKHSTVYFLILESGMQILVIGEKTSLDSWENIVASTVTKPAAKRGRPSTKTNPIITQED